MSLLGVQVAGTGSFLPERVVTNDDLSQTLDTSDEWIRTRTGIGSRHFAGDEQATSDLALPAAQRAIEAAGVAAEDVDLIICCTMTTDQVMPTTAAFLQRGLNATRAGGYDLNSACSGFVLGFTTGCNYIRTGSAECVLVVGAEKMSSIVDHTDRSTAVIFADGAGAVILRPVEAGGSTLLASHQGLKGDPDMLAVRAGGSRLPLTPALLEERANLIEMKGRETFKFAVRTFSSLIQETCSKAGVTPDDLKLIVPHQVNMRILEKACTRTGIETSALKINISRVGNTSAASVAIALDEAVREGAIERGDLLLLVAFGGGLSWASALVRW